MGDICLKISEIGIVESPIFVWLKIFEISDLDTLTKNKIESGNEHYKFFIDALEEYADIISTKEYEGIISEPIIEEIFTYES